MIDAVDKAVKWIEKEPSCEVTTTITAGHTSFVIEMKCKEGKMVDLALITTVDESETSYSFLIARNEYDLRKVQRKLLDFANYIDQ